MDGRGALKWVLVETRPTAAILYFWAKITTQNRVYDPYKKITFLPFKIAHSLDPVGVNLRSAFSVVFNSR